jgi:hypothetical protein
VLAGRGRAADRPAQRQPGLLVAADRDDPASIEEVQDAGSLDQPHSG